MMALMQGASITVYGVCAVSIMMVMYALESRGRQFLALSASCELNEFNQLGPPRGGSP